MTSEILRVLAMANKGTAAVRGPRPLTLAVRPNRALVSSHRLEEGNTTVEEPRAPTQQEDTLPWASRLCS
jgi:hypothetical protein